MTTGHCSDHYCLFEGSVQGGKKKIKRVCVGEEGGVCLLYTSPSPRDFG